MATSDKKFGYVVTRSGNSYDHNHFRHLTIEVRAGHYGLSGDPACTFTWQSDADDSRWYGFKVKVEGTVDQVAECLAIAKRLVPKDRCSFEVQPSDILAALAKRKIGRVAYDGRVFDYVPVEEVLPDNIQKWLDDYRALGNSTCHAGCLAACREHAQEFIAAELAKDPDTERLAQFERAGRPVMVNTWASAPTIQPLEELLMTSKAEQDAARLAKAA